MKKRLIPLLILTLLWALCACGSSSPFSGVEKNYTIQLPLYQLTQCNNVAGSYEYSDFVFDDKGRVTEKKMSGSDRGTLTYEYDEQGRVISETDTGSYGYEKTSYTYNEEGLISTASETSDFSVRDGNVFEYTYERDGQNRVVKMTTVNVTDEDRYTTVYDYEYDDAGNIIRETQTTPLSTYVLECTYDSQGHRILERVENLKKGSSHTNTYAYEYAEHFSMSPDKNSELAAPESWISFEENEGLPVPDSCVTSITSAGDDSGVYRLPGEKEAAYLEYLKYQTILSDLCGFVLEWGDDGSIAVLKEDQTVAVMKVGYDEKGYTLCFSFDA